MATMIDKSVLVIEECCSCHIRFALPQDLQQRAINNHSISFYCPMGHGQSYTGPTPAQQLRKDLEAEQGRRRRAEIREQAKQDQLDATQRSLSATKGVVTRTKNRIAAGVCPCCNRKFENLHRHMSGQHPDYAKPE